MVERQTIRIIPLNLHIGRNMRLSENLPLRNDDPLFARVALVSRVSMSPIILIIICNHRAQSDRMGVASFRKVRTVPVPSTLFSAVRPWSVFLLTAVFANDAGKEAGGNRLEGWDGGGEDSDVGFDDGPVHGAADHVGRIGGAKHGWDVGDSDDGRDTGAGIVLG